MLLQFLLDKRRNHGPVDLFDHIGIGGVLLG